MRPDIERRGFWPLAMGGFAVTLLWVIMTTSGSSGLGMARGGWAGSFGRGMKCLEKVVSSFGINVTRGTDVAG